MTMIMWHWSAARGANGDPGKAILLPPDEEPSAASTEDAILDCGLGDWVRGDFAMSRSLHAAGSEKERAASAAAYEAHMSLSDDERRKLVPERVAKGAEIVRAWFADVKASERRLDDVVRSRAIAAAVAAGLDYRSEQFARLPTPPEDAAVLSVAKDAHDAIVAKATVARDVALGKL